MSFQHYVAYVASGEAYDFSSEHAERAFVTMMLVWRVELRSKSIASGKESGLRFNCGHRVTLHSRNASSHTLWRIIRRIILGKGPPETYRGRLSFSGSRSPACGLTALDVSPWVITV